MIVEKEVRGQKFNVERVKLIGLKSFIRKAKDWSSYKDVSDEDITKDFYLITGTKPKAKVKETKPEK